MVENIRNRAIDALPNVGKRVICTRASLAANIFEGPQHLAECDRIRRSREQIPAIGTASRVYKPILLQTRQNQLQELLRDLLTLAISAIFTGLIGEECCRAAKYCDAKSKTAFNAYSLFTEMFIRPSASILLPDPYLQGV